jgi:hypothetical protein
MLYNLVLNYEHLPKYAEEDYDLEPLSWQQESEPRYKLDTSLYFSSS